MDGPGQAHTHRIYVLGPSPHSTSQIYRPLHLYLVSTSLLLVERSLTSIIYQPGRVRLVFGDGTPYPIACGLPATVPPELIRTDGN